MANYTATGNSKHATLAASVVDVVTLDKAYVAIEVINRHATADLYFTVDRGASNDTTLTPTVAGDGCWYIGPGGVRVITDDTPRTVSPGTGVTPASVIRLISASAVPYSVTGC